VCLPIPPSGQLSDDKSKNKFLNDWFLAKKTFRFARNKENFK